MLGVFAPLVRALVFKTSGGFEQSSLWVRFPYTPAIYSPRCRILSRDRAESLERQRVAARSANRRHSPRLPAAPHFAPQVRRILRRLFPAAILAPGRMPFRSDRRNDAGPRLAYCLATSLRSQAGNSGPDLVKLIGV